MRRSEGNPEMETENMYIATFVPFKYAKRIIRPSEDGNGTFALRSLRSCQLLEEIERDTTIGDKNEGHHRFVENGRVCHRETGAPIMVSCWTMIDEDYVTEKAWMDLYRGGGQVRFARTDGIALVSTVDKVTSFFQEQNKCAFLGQERQFTHGKVRKPEEPDEPFDGIFGPALRKDDSYSYQREYRFMFDLPSECQWEKIEFYVADPCAYIDKIQFGPEMKCSQRKELLSRTFGAFVAILDHPNFDELQRTVRCPLMRFLQDRQ